MGLIMKKGALRKRKQLRTLVLFIIGLIVINILCSKVSTRWDLTSDNRYTLSQPSQSRLKNLKGEVHIKIFLQDEDLPASFRHFSKSIKILLEDFNRYAGGKIHFVFFNPLEGASGSEKRKIIDSLTHLGITPYNIRAQANNSEGVTTQMIFPAALIDYQGHKIGINLLQSQPGGNPQQSLNYSTTLLEYKFIHAISRLTKGKPPRIAYILGNGETLNPSVYDLFSILDHHYRWDTLNLKKVSNIPKSYRAVIILDPSKSFTKKEKIKIDQYVMHGGKILWGIHPTQASMDSLQTQNSFLAYDHRLNLKNLLFTWGVRVNPDILQDLQCFAIPITIGHIGNRPQIKRLPWLYAPLLTPAPHHTITNNLNLIYSSFPGSIDTTHSKNIRKTILLATSNHSRIISVPQRISMEEVKNKPNPAAFREQHLPVAILLEGQFRSVFKNRLSKTELGYYEKTSGQKYRAQSPPNSMIVVSDPNIFKNKVSKKDGPLPMGMDKYTRKTFANRTFFKNCLTYLTDSSNIMMARNKERSLHLLNKTKVEKQKKLWIALNFAIPILFILLFGIIFQYVRKRNYTE